MKKNSITQGKILLEKLKLVEEEMYIHPSEMFISINSDFNYINSTLEASLIDANSNITQIKEYNERFEIAEQALLKSLKLFQESIQSITLPEKVENEQESATLQKCLSALTDIQTFSKLAKDLRTQLYDMCRVYNESDNTNLSEKVMQTLKNYEKLSTDLTNLYNSSLNQLKSNFAGNFRLLQAELRMISTKLEDSKINSDFERLLELQETSTKNISKLLKDLETSGDNINTCYQLQINNKLDQSISNEEAEGVSSKTHNANNAMNDNIKNSLVNHLSKLSELVNSTSSQIKSSKLKWKQISDQIVSCMDNQKNYRENKNLFSDLYEELNELLNKMNAKFLNNIGMHLVLKIVSI